MLIGDDGRLKAHSVVLAAASDMFKASLKSGDMPKEHVIVFPGVQMYMLEIVVRFAYTGDILVHKSHMNTDQMSRIIPI